MSIDLVTRFLPYVDEKFSTESKSALITNHDFDFDGANTVKIRKVSTAPMTNYGRSGPASGNWSRFGQVDTLNSVSETFTLSKDRAFTFVIDKMDENEAAESLAPARALERQLREVVIPEIDTYMIGEIFNNAGTVREIYNASESFRIYHAIMDGSEKLDEWEVPEDGRILIVPPRTFHCLKTTPAIAMQMNVGEDVVKNGVLATLDGMKVVRVPANRLPEDTAFMIVHPCASVGVQKLQDYRIHVDPPGISGSLVEGRVVYDVFPLENKVKAIYAAKFVNQIAHVLTQDTTVQTGKTYYTNVGFTFTEVENPTGNPKTQDWYEDTPNVDPEDDEDDNEDD